jgi:hypothetical protein
LQSMKSDPSTFEIVISSQDDDLERRKDEEETETEDHRDLNISIEVIYNTPQSLDLNDTMDPFGYRNANGTNNEIFTKRSRSESTAAAVNVRLEIDDEEPNPADCSIILSECFSGEDTAETTAPSNLNLCSPKRKVSPTQANGFIPSEDVDTTAVATTPTRYLQDPSSLHNNDATHRSPNNGDDASTTTTASSAHAPTVIYSMPVEVVPKHRPSVAPPPSPTSRNYSPKSIISDTQATTPTAI